MNSVSILFNHSQLLANENSRFAKEVDESLTKVANSLTNTSSLVQDVDSNILPSSTNITQEYLTQVQARILVCAQMAEKVSSSEKSDKLKNYIENLANKQKERSKSCEEYLKKAKAEKDKIEGLFTEQSKKLYDHYTLKNENDTYPNL